MEKAKPPLGLMPRHIWLKKRIAEIKEAISRYDSAKKDVPKEWFVELKQLIETYNNGDDYAVSPEMIDMLKVMCKDLEACMAGLSAVTRVPGYNIKKSDVFKEFCSDLAKAKQIIKKIEGIDNGCDSN